MTESSGNNVSEEFKISIRTLLEDFSYSDEDILALPVGLNNVERRYVHTLCRGLGMPTKSKNEKSGRILYVNKLGFEKARAPDVHHIDIPSMFHGRLKHHMNGVSKKRDNSKSFVPSFRHRKVTVSSWGDLPGFRKNTKSYKVEPPLKTPSRNMKDFRRNLPAYSMRNELIDGIEKNQVVLVSGETGSGKTTQIPQFLLERAHAGGTNARILVSQPRRISAISVSQRVAAERGEVVGESIGYHIRLENVMPKRQNWALFCTAGVLVRMFSDPLNVDAITHIVMDEVHERSCFSDYVLILLKDLLRSRPQLKVILMSATLNTDLFKNYFNGCPHYHIPGFTHSVRVHYLEDVLLGMSESSENNVKRVFGLDTSCKSDNDIPPVSNSLIVSNHQYISEEEQEDHALWVYEEMGFGIEEAFHDRSYQAVSSLLHLIEREGADVNWTNSKNGVTPLMVAALLDMSEEVSKLLDLGANTSLRSLEGFTAADYASANESIASLTLITAQQRVECSSMTDSPGSYFQSKSSSLEALELLQSYEAAITDERNIDTQLIVDVLSCICRNSSDHNDCAILVFLPGLEDILGLKACLLRQSHDFGNENRYLILPLHSSLKSSDQQLVFKRPNSGVRKIVLATNIAETSVTIDDVVFVVDSGKFKEQVYDARTNTSALITNWVSQAAADQRRGRAGRCRPGVCLRLFSRKRREALLPFQQAEIFRTPLDDICLRTRIILDSYENVISNDANSCIERFLAMAPEAPSPRAIHASIKSLQHIGALDENERVTDLGDVLSQLSLTVRLAKMLLIAVVLGCVDPILTVACTLGYRDPFLTVPNHIDKKLKDIRCDLACATGSDHCALHMGFEKWVYARYSYSFCDTHCMSISTLHMVAGMRKQLKKQLMDLNVIAGRGGYNLCNKFSHCWPVVAAALCGGLAPNIAQRLGTSENFSTSFHKKVVLHKSALLFPIDPSVRFVVFNETIRQCQTIKMRSVSSVSPLSVFILTNSQLIDNSQDGLPLKNEEASDAEDIQSIDRPCARFKANIRELDLLNWLQCEWKQVFNRFVYSSIKRFSLTSRDEAFVSLFIDMICYNDRSSINEYHTSQRNKTSKKTKSTPSKAVE